MELKKAKLEADQAAGAKILKAKHAEEAAKAEFEAKTKTIEVEERRIEAKARMAQARAKRAEAKALRAGDTATAEQQKIEAKAHQAKAIAQQIVIKEKYGLKRALPKKKPEESSENQYLNEPINFSEKKYLSATGLLKTIRERFLTIEGCSSSTQDIPLVDCLMSGLAIFSLKSPSLLQFDQKSREEIIKHNLKTLYGIEKVPCDTYLRERLDEVLPFDVRRAFKDVFASFQRGKALEPYAYLEGKYLLAVDGTGFFSSGTVYCEHCCEKHHRDGRVTYYHQSLAAVIVHPEKKEVIPLCPEPILYHDGSTKNDCESNAAKRLLRDVHREHPHLGLIIVQDALSANGPQITEIKSHGYSHITAVTPEGNSSLYEWMKGIELTEVLPKIDPNIDGNVSIKLRFLNNIPLNNVYNNLMVNFFECIETNLKTGKVTTFSWVTDILITKTNVYQLMRGGRARWHIENETFNTLKNQGYAFEHNFGHGHKYLSTIFMMLMMLAFLIDQVQQATCTLFQAALKKVTSRARLWEKMRELFFGYFIENWKDLWLAIAGGHNAAFLRPNTS